MIIRTESNSVNSVNHQISKMNKGKINERRLFKQPEERQQNDGNK